VPVCTRIARHVHATIVQVSAASGAAASDPATLTVTSNSWTSPGRGMVQFYPDFLADINAKADTPANSWSDYSTPQSYRSTVGTGTKAFVVRANDRFGNAQIGELPGLWACAVVRGECLANRCLSNRSCVR
jgi:hypothetical protein